MDEGALKARVAALLERATIKEGVDVGTRGNEVFHGAVTVLEAAYGTGSRQVEGMIESFKKARDTSTGRADSKMYYALDPVRGALENLKAELDAGLTGSLRQRLAGAVLSDFVGLARAVLEDSSEGAKNVAAVLGAAAFEDTIRRMGRELADVMGGDDLADVIEALKRAGVLQAPQLGIAISYLKFRNDALHAHWDKIAREAVHSVLGFVEQLLLKHFS